MKLQRSQFLLFLLLVASSSFSFAMPEDTAFKTMITVISQSEYNLTAKITYFNLSYFSKLNQEEIKKDPMELQPDRQASFDYIRTGVSPLPNAPIFFTLDGKNISLDGSNAACNPAYSDEEGVFKCSFLYYQNESGQYAHMDSRTSCGTLTLTYDGGFIGDKELKPSSTHVLVCPKKNAALSAFGPAFISSISSPTNITVCFPALLITGLLLASMYYSGRNPLSLFDLTTPRLPKGKHARISGGSTAMAIRTAVTRYNQAKRMAQRDTEKLVKKLARASGKSAGDAKKEIRKLFKDLDKELAKSPDGINERTLDMYRSRLNDIFTKYGLSRDESSRFHRKMYSRYLSISYDLFNVFYLSDQAMRQMASARSPGGGKFKKWLDKKQSALTKKLVSFESELQNIPGYGKLRAIPVIGSVFNVAGLPHKVLDTIAQRRSAKAYMRAITRRAVGHIPYLMFTKKRKDEEGRELNKIGEEMQKLFNKGPLAWMAKYYDWSFEKFIERHNIYMRQASHFFDAEAKYARQLAEALNYSKAALREVLEMELLIEGMLAEKKKKLEKMSDSPSKNKLSVEYEKIENAYNRAQKGEINFSEVCHLLMKYANSEQKKTLAQYMSKLATFGNDLQEFKQLEQKIITEYGLFMKTQGLYSELTFDNLRDVARRAEFEAVEVARKKGVKVADSEEYVRNNRADVEKIIEASLSTALLKRLGLSASEVYNILLLDKSQKKEDRAKAESEFTEKIRKPLANSIIRELNKEIDENGQIRREGVLSKYMETVEKLSSKINPEGIILGKDPAGQIIYKQLEKIANATGNKELIAILEKYKVDSISSLEQLFEKGSTKEFVRLLNNAIVSLRLSGNEEAIKEISKILSEGILRANKQHEMYEQLSAVLDTRNRLATAIGKLSEDQLLKLCKTLNLPANAKKGTMPTTDD
ncbi:MAG: hypothetical protein QW275_03040, partial [Candidatus Anstonellaceae archaeon]